MKKLTDYTTLVWDFNGTLLDDVTVGIRAVNAMLDRRSLPILPDTAAYHAVFGFPIKDYYRRLGFDFSREPFSELAVEWVAEYRANEHYASLREGAIGLLMAARDAGLRQVILSATESVMLRGQLLDLGILDFFDELVGRDDIYATDKRGIATAWAEKQPKGRILMIGDTGHDLACAQAAGFDIVLLRGGHTSDSALDSLGCPVLRNLTELKEKLTNADN